MRTWWHFVWAFCTAFEVVLWGPEGGLWGPEGVLWGLYVMFVRSFCEDQRVVKEGVRASYEGFLFCLWGRSVSRWWFVRTWGRLVRAFCSICEGVLWLWDTEGASPLPGIGPSSSCWVWIIRPDPADRCQVLPSTPHSMASHPHDLMIL